MITYDETKRMENIRKHGFDFVAADEILAGFTVCREDGRDAYGETRFQSIGLLRGTVVFMVHTQRGDADRIISIRRAKRHEERIFWAACPG